jgi:hypothetical protein
VKRLIPLVLLLAACTAVAEDTTTTAPLAEPSTTTSTTALTTTTTTTDEECSERDGVLRTSRGFVCPPSMVDRGVGIGGDESQIHLGGSYETRLFLPRFSFTQPAMFRSRGESVMALDLDFTCPIEDCTRKITAFSHDVAEEIIGEDPAQRLSFASDLRRTLTRIGGVPADRLDFSLSATDCDELRACALLLPSLADEPVGLGRDTRNVLFVIETPTLMVILVEARTVLFDAYWTEVAEPILDSIEFLDD